MNWRNVGIVTVLMLAVWLPVYWALVALGAPTWMTAPACLGVSVTMGVLTSERWPVRKG